MNFGWVKLHRKIWDNPRADSSWVAVFCYLLCNATHKSLEAVFGGKKITLQPGQLITGRDAISASNKIHRSKVERLLKIMEIEQQIEQQTSNKNRLITIKNWKIYQGEDFDEQQNEQQASNKRATDLGEIEHKQEEDKNKNNKNKTLPTLSRGQGPKRVKSVFVPTEKERLIYALYFRANRNDSSSVEKTCRNIRVRVEQGKSIHGLAISVYRYILHQKEHKIEVRYWDKAQNFFGEKSTYERYYPETITDGDKNEVEKILSSLQASSQVKTQISSAAPPTQGNS